MTAAAAARQAANQDATRAEQVKEAVTVLATAGQGTARAGGENDEHLCEEDGYGKGKSRSEGKEE